MSSLVLDTGSPVLSDRGSPGTSTDMLSPQLIEEEAHHAIQESPRATGSGRTRLSRASKADCLLRMNRRVSMKPQKKLASGGGGKPDLMSSEKDIKKFYLNNKLGSAASRHNALETIFEEPSVVRNELRMIGLKKLKRTMNFKDGFTVSKTTVQSRRKKIKTLFGTTSKKFNKLSMDAFLEHLQSMREDEGEEGGDEAGDPYRSMPVGGTGLPSTAGATASVSIPAPTSTTTTC